MEGNELWTTREKYSKIPIMSDEDILRQEIYDLQQQLYLQSEVVRLWSMLERVLVFEQMNPTYRLDSVTKTVSEHYTPIFPWVYSKN